jgi:hypothetical protein
VESESKMTIEEIVKADKDGLNFTVEGWSGIGFYFCDIETRPDGFPDYMMPDEIPTGNVIMVMVGDDRKHIVDPNDVSEINEPLCSCGQIGCGANV